jgi:hypothetical protein
MQKIIAIHSFDDPDIPTLKVSFGGTEIRMECRASHKNAETSDHFVPFRIGGIRYLDKNLRHI